MEASNDIMIRISPNEGKITVEEDAQGVFSRKSITEEDLLRCFKDSLRTADEGYHSGFLPLNTISLYQSETVKRFVLWHPRLYADVSVYDTPYPHFPIPRLVFGFSLNQEGKASHCRIGVVADEIPTPETPMYYYPFSNVSRESGSLCVGANTLPIYKKPHKALLQQLQQQVRTGISGTHGASEGQRPRILLFGHSHPQKGNARRVYSTGLKERISCGTNQRKNFGRPFPPPFRAPTLSGGRGR